MIKIGITEKHGIAEELSKFPPPNVKYKWISPKKHYIDRFVTSSAKGVLNYFEDTEIDLIEAPLFPILTKQNWIYTPADIHTALNFGFWGLPIPRKIRLVLLRNLFMRKNFKRLIFKSQAGKNTLRDMLSPDDELWSKVDVVYPAVRTINDDMIRFNTKMINILFLGNFFPKGGAHVLDAFEELLKKFSNITLRICSRTDLGTSNTQLAQEYWDRIKNNNKIFFGYVSRTELLNKILPETDLFVMPTYRDSYGYAIEEAMAYGIPVISTNLFAIPELVEHRKSGFLINVQQFDYIREFRNYRVSSIPKEFHRYMSSEVFKYMDVLVSNFDLRKAMGLAGLKIARQKFSFEKRNAKMAEIYRMATGKDISSVLFDGTNIASFRQ